MYDRIAIVGAGAVGGYVGAHMARSGLEPVLIDAWPEHVEHMRRHGLSIAGVTPEEAFSTPVRALHITDVQSLARESPIDIAFVCVKSYDSEWAATLIRPYLSERGFVVSLQNCMNDERIAGVVGWGRELGCIASRILVDLVAPGRVQRGVARGGAAYTVFRIGEAHGRATPRAQAAARVLSTADSAKVTANLWGERWSKLVANAMENGMSACTGMSGNEIARSAPHRRFQIRLASETIRVGQALGYALEPVIGMDPEVLAHAAEGDAAALTHVEEVLLAKASKRADGQVASMGQDMRKGRRTEIDYINGYVVAQAASIGRDVPANRLLTELVKSVERGKTRADPQSILQAPC
ncbi:MAG: 2-dehydropantoate 2-reductase [Betaproteobacteria bacterium]|nr:2-dehydropantoate 2-reductase [Betaproteobacteria bacterium]